MAYLLSNICTKNYWNRTTSVEIIVGGWVVSFFETECTNTKLTELGCCTRLPLTRPRRFLGLAKSLSSFSVAVFASEMALAASNKRRCRTVWTTV